MLKRFAARAHRPQALDAVAADPDIPVVQIAGRIAMAGHQSQFLVECQGIARIGDIAVFVGAGDVLDIVAAEYAR